jgi:ligand-binding sensor domain-containing protein
VQVSKRTLWVICGNRWLVVDLNSALGDAPSSVRGFWVDDGASFLSSSPAGQKQIELADAVALQLVENKKQHDVVAPVSAHIQQQQEEEGTHKTENRSLVQVWSCHRDGRVLVWCAVPHSLQDGKEEGLLVPKLEKEASAAKSMAEDKEMGRVYCMTQVSEQEMWVGTSRGRVVALDILSCSLASRQPPSLPSTLRSVDALVSSYCPSSSLSASSSDWKFRVWAGSQDETLRVFRKCDPSTQP